MRSKIAIACLTLATAGYCVDEYLPIEAGKYEIDAGANILLGRGHYDADGNLGGSTGKGGQVPLQLKYGIMPGLDAELALTFETLGAGITGTPNKSTGFLPPELAVKYSLKDLNPEMQALQYTAVYLNIGLPMATGDKDGDWSVAPGVVYGQNFDKFQAVGLAAYQINTAEGADNKFTLFLKPGYLLNDAAAGYLGIKLESQGDASLTTLLPGATYTLSKEISLEANLPITVMGKSNSATWGLWASLYYTL